MIRVNIISTETNKVVGISPDGKLLCRGHCLSPYDCPPVECDLNIKPSLNNHCYKPECWDSVKRSFLWPTAHPAYFYQCNPVQGGWDSVIRECSCATYFDYELQQCVHPYEWKRHCDETPEPLPLPLDCIQDYDDNGDDVI
jgi:hypothetical protein